MTHRVLIVEDNPADVYLIKSALAEHSVTAEFEVVADGERARSAVNEFQAGTQVWPNLVLLDINLPKIDGLELLQRLASAPCPVIVMSSSQSPSDRQQAMENGAACYFWKPTDLDGFLKLGEIVSALLAQKAGRHQIGSC
jgi:CheY-like chemotaxis protein